MTDQQHPITPPPELVRQWCKSKVTLIEALDIAAQWGADQELEACCSLINLAHSDPAATGDHRLVDKTVLLKQLRAARRPKSNSMAKPLSPAAQAVLGAAFSAYWSAEQEAPNDAQMIAAAVLQAAADQVVPEPPMIVEGGRTYEEAWTATVHDDIRRRFLAIAAELEQLDD